MREPVIGRRALLAGSASALAAMPAAAQPTATITIDHEAFAPATLAVAPGTAVTWDNKDHEPHNVVSAEEPRAFRSPLMDTGERFAFTFAQAGIYRYFCALHPHMVGVVVVA